MIIEKVVAPENISNKELFGTPWIADIESGKQVWIQTSKDEDKPKWVRLGQIYEECFIENPVHYLKLLSLMEKGITTSDNS